MGDLLGQIGFGWDLFLLPSFWFVRSTRIDWANRSQLESTTKSPVPAFNCTESEMSWVFSKHSVLDFITGFVSVHVGLHLFILSAWKVPFLIRQTNAFSKAWHGMTSGTASLLSMMHGKKVRGWLTRLRLEHLAFSCQGAWKIQKVAPMAMNGLITLFFQPWCSQKASIIWLFTDSLCEGEPAAGAEAWRWSMWAGECGIDDLLRPRWLFHSEAGFSSIMFWQWVPRMPRLPG